MTKERIREFGTIKELADFLEVEESLHDKPKKNKTEKDIKVILFDIGIPISLTGYNYIVYSARLATEDSTILEHVTKTLYPEVAKRFITTRNGAERGIRKAIEVAWRKEKLSEWFDSKPTNTEFLKYITKMIK